MNRRGGRSNLVPSQVTENRINTKTETMIFKIFLVCSNPFNIYQPLSKLRIMRKDKKESHLIQFCFSSNLNSNKILYIRLKDYRLCSPHKDHMSVRLCLGHIHSHDRRTWRDSPWNWCTHIWELINKCFNNNPHPNTMVGVYINMMIFCLSFEL